MAGKIYKRETAINTGFAIVDETGEVEVYTVGDDGRAFLHEDYFDNEFEDCWAACRYLDGSTWKGIDSLEDYQFFQLVKTASEKGVTVDEVEYGHPQIEEDEAQAIAWPVTWKLPAGIRVMSVIKIRD